MQALAIGIAVSLAGCALESPDSGALVAQALNPTDSNDHQYNDATGTLSTHSTAGVIIQTGAFFQVLGSNDRACFTCHEIDQGWSITPAGVQARFDATSGTDPIFRTVDGSNSPNADVSTLAAGGPTSASSRARSCARCRRGPRTFTTDSPRRSTRSSRST